MLNRSRYRLIAAALASSRLSSGVACEEHAAAAVEGRGRLVAAANAPAERAGDMISPAERAGDMGDMSAARRGASACAEASRVPSYNIISPTSDAPLVPRMRELDPKRGRSCCAMPPPMPQPPHTMPPPVDGVALAGIAIGGAPPTAQDGRKRKHGVVCHPSSRPHAPLIRAMLDDHMSPPHASVSWR